MQTGLRGVPWKPKVASPVLVIHLLCSCLEPFFTLVKLQTPFGPLRFKVAPHAPEPL